MKQTNPLYEKLILAFFEKALITHDGTSMHAELKKKYAKCNLPNPRTFQRFLDAETINPRDNVLGYIAAYILNIKPKEVEKSEAENKLGDFFTAFLENPKPQSQLKRNALLVIELTRYLIKTLKKTVVQKIIQPEKKILVILYVVTAIAVSMFVYILRMWFK